MSNTNKDKQSISASRGMFFCEGHLENLPLKGRSPDMPYCKDCYEIIKGERTTTSTPDSWSECGQIFFSDGEGFGLTEDLYTICLGKESDIKKSLEIGQLNGGFNPTQRQVLSSILDYRKEQGIGANIGATGMVRTGNDATPGDRKKAARPPAPRKRLPLRPPRTKNEGLSGR